MGPLTEKFKIELGFKTEIQCRKRNNTDGVDSFRRSHMSSRLITQRVELLLCHFEDYKQHLSRDDIVLTHKKTLHL